MGGMVNFTIPFTTNQLISISTSHTFRSCVVIFHHRWSMAFLCLSLYDTTELAPRMFFFSEGQATFKKATFESLPRGTLEIVIKDVLWSIRGSYSAIWSLPLINDECYSGPWPVALTSQPIRLTTNFMTFIPTLTFTEFTSGFYGAFSTGVACQQGALTLPDTWFVPLIWTCLCSNC